MKAINEISLLWNFSDPHSAEVHCASRDEEVVKHCKSLFRAKRVPIIHNVKTPALHQLAREKLLPLALASTELTRQPSHAMPENRLENAHRHDACPLAFDLV